ncbi:hypothetical protein BS50DRAFT_594699 [Corynespora cassiicola Philippines]|uniref:Nudix hydrolase domain-containing protein n=1 Tax=Corynespora cassiicola Philippines TaxID=1448308 RepID=A0A2T2N1Z6_CORCC|nr:hypothetical protein BS50DRAFT_594699 [Corynespora cassiicola Philippines]
MTTPNMRLVDWLDDLCARFIINLPQEELKEVERICFQIEEAQWFYEDFIRPLDPSLPSMNLRRFSQLMFLHCPIFSAFAEQLSVHAYDNFLAYKSRVPVRGAIMLNQDMTHAVLVKGWKKGAKWSFPRGKINKDEPDLDCAVREVYEETGYDLREAGLVGPDDQMKKIPVNMREQNMLLYVFRGVPMDTHFEPRTRKEISKIDWYRLTDLPTLKRKNQAQQGTGQDMIKENNFYMVAPFLGPLKGWIKQQHRLDKQRAKAGAKLPAQVATGITDTDEVEAALGDTTADEGPIAAAQAPDESFHSLVAKLQQAHRASDALPEVSAQPQTEQVLDPAAELKRLLSVGSAIPTQTPPVEAPEAAHGAPVNPLLAMLQASSKPSVPPEPHPRTPFEQVMSPPAQPQSPHGQHHPRQPHLEHMAPPPPFGLHQQPHLAFRGPPYPHMTPHSNGPPMPIPPQFMPPPPHSSNPVFSTHAPNVQQGYNQQAPRPYHRTGDPHFDNPQFPGVHAPAIPPASKLPAPKLTAHALGLLNAFKMNEKPAASPPQAPSQPQLSSHTTPKTQQPPVPHQTNEPIVSPPRGLSSVHAHPPSPPSFQSPPPNENFEPAQPKPRSAHQDSLLNLFRAPSVPATTPPPPRIAEGPVELSAYPATPGYTFAQTAPNQVGPPMPDLQAKQDLLDAFGALPKKPGLTSATVKGPVNAPDFETMKKNTHHTLNGHSRGPSPSEKKSGHQNMFIPPQLLRRESSRDRQSPVAMSPKTASSMATPQASTFQPQILRRPQQTASPGPITAPGNAHAQALLDAFKKPASPASVPAQASGQVLQAPAAHGVQASFDKRDTAAPDQKNALLSLFSKPAQTAASPNSKAPLPASPVPPARSPQPPTPKTRMSGVMSPVSPLPDKGSLQGSPADLNSRSRISSIGETMPPNIIIPHTIPTSYSSTGLPLSAIGQKNGLGPGAEDGYASTGSTGLNELAAVEKGKGKAPAEGKSPVDKTFLLGFLEDVARRGR